MDVWDDARSRTRETGEESSWPRPSSAGAMGLALAAFAALSVAGCASSQRAAYGSYNPQPSYRLTGDSETASLPKGGGSAKIGAPYEVAGRVYVPREEPGYDRRGQASWYGDDFHGRRTANGELYDMHALTAAHPTMPLPSYAYVTNLENGRTILVRVNDRGPYVDGRLIDLSRASADALSMRGRGVGSVRVRYAGPAPIDGDDRRERRFLAEQSWSRGPTLAAADMDRGRSWPDTTWRGGWSLSDYRAGASSR